MKSSIAIAITAAAVTVSAAPPATDPRLVGEHQANFESMVNGNYVAYNGGPFPGPYEALNWTAETPGYCFQTCSIGPSTFPIQVQAQPTDPLVLSATYAGSKVAAFTPQNFTAGCYAVFDNPNPSPGTGPYSASPVNCTYTLRGWHGEPVGPPAATQTLNYVPTIVKGLLGQPAAGQSPFSVSPLFTAMRTVSFTPSVNKNTGPANQLYGLMDTFRYQVTNFTL